MGGPNSAPRGDTVMSQSPRLCQVVVLPVLVVLLLSIASQAVVAPSVRLTLAVVLPSVGDGTARARETQDEMFLGSKFEST